MSDAAELLMVLYQQLQPVAVRAGQPDLVDLLFGLNVQVASAQQHLQPCPAHLYHGLSAGDFVALEMCSSLHMYSRS